MFAVCAPADVVSAAAVTMSYTLAQNEAVARSFEKGASSTSPTYDNAVLAGSTDFAVIKVEVWALGHAL